MKKFKPNQRERRIRREEIQALQTAKPKGVDLEALRAHLQGNKVVGAYVGRLCGQVGVDHKAGGMR